MKIITVINENEDERIEIHSHKRDALVEQIEELVNNYGVNINGYRDDEIVPLKPEEIFRVYVSSNKVFASTDSGEYQLKYRLYRLEEMLGEQFIKVNQSTLVNKKKIKKFSSSWGGSLIVELKNGETDFISRRQQKTVMERMGVK
ncbi:MAG: LytTR family transcriptional regulator [Ruminococcaceae bacterium]|jgi:DNA-binding LytR/AlgR family response regulator|nr:LytTR family transcriptional regulator [Oscillospiraceae bacterium]